MRSLFLALAFIVISGPSGTAIANDIFNFSDMQTRATAPGMKTSAAYLEITNNGALDDRLIAAQAAIAQRVEIHPMEIDGGVMRMRAFDVGLVIAAGDIVTRALGGLHVMLMGSTTDLPAGSQHEITLVFEKAGQVMLTATAKLPAEIKMTMLSHEALHDHTIPKTSQ